MPVFGDLTRELSLLLQNYNLNITLRNKSDWFNGQNDLLSLLLNFDVVIVDVTTVVTNVDAVVVVVDTVVLLWRFSEKSIEFDWCFFFFNNSIHLMLLLIYLLMELREKQFLFQIKRNKKLTAEFVFHDFLYSMIRLIDDINISITRDKIPNNDGKFSHFSANSIKSL